MAEVRIEALVKIFPDGTVAVDDVSLHIDDGEFLVLLGPSGCGKTTTLRCVAGLESQTTGDIYIGDRLVNGVHPGERDTAFVFQFYALYPHLSAYDNIAFPLRATGVSQAEIDRRVREVAETLRIRHILRKRPQSLPSGEQQRVALGRAIVRRPQVFLMDEPLTNLDAALRGDMRVQLKHLQQELGVTTLYVTHDQTEAMTMGHRIAVMNRGVLQQLGTPLEVYEHPATLFVAGFIGDPPMNLIPVTLEENTLKGLTSSLSVALETELASRIRIGRTGPNLVLGVRAEDIHIQAGEGEADVHAAITTHEPLGDQMLYSVALDGQFVQITTSPTQLLDVGDQVRLQFNRSRMRVFDAASENLLI